MKLSIVFAITLLLAVTFASSPLTAKDSPTGHVSRLTSGQEDALKVLALEGETHKKVVGRADPSKVAKFIEIHELFKEIDIESTFTDKEEVFEFAVAYVPCEIAWHLRIIDVDETIHCLERSASWKVTSKVGDKVLVNFFADKHAFELIQLLKTTNVGNEKLLLNIQKLLSSQGLILSASSAFFLQHALALHKQDPTSERQEMVKNFLSLHLSAIATMLEDQEMIKELYTELAQNVPTLFAGSLPDHAIAVVATRVKEDEYDIVIVNSGSGLSNHKSTTDIQPKGFHTGASYDDASISEPIKATSYNPLLRMKEVTGEHLSSTQYHFGMMDQVYYVAKNASSCIVTEPLMPWEWAEEQGIGTCTATSVWLALHFYYQAPGYVNDIRLSMLDQAVGDLEELQDKVEGLERQMNADYQKLREAFRETHEKTSHFRYDQDRVKGLKLAKDRAEKSLRLRRVIISVALNEILRNVIVWHHELGDINADLLTKDKEFEEIVQYSKMEQRQKVLEKAIRQSMTSFHGFWALQAKKYLKRQSEIVGTEAAPASVLDSWHSIREDVRTMYNDAIRVTKIEPEFTTVLAERTAVKQTFKPINVTSLKEHASLRKILRYIINFGDSSALRGAVSRHLRTHTKNANAAKYLIVLYACLTRNVPLLDYLVVEKKLPLRYTIDRTKRDTSVSMHWDLTTEDSIAALAAHGFVKHGQPLNIFPELFRMSKKETRRIVNKFKKVYRRIALIINAKAPSQDDIDKAFKVLVKQGRIAAIAYILPRTSKKAISDAFLETKSVKVLRLLIDLLQDPKLLEQKMEKCIKEGNVGVIEFLLPLHLHYQKHAIEKDMIEKQHSGSAVNGKPAEASLAGRLLDAAYAGNALKVMELLAPFAKESAIKDLLSKAATSGKSEMAHKLSKYATDGAIFAAIEEANKKGHGDLAKALFEDYASKNPTEVMFLEAAEHGNVDELEDRILRVSAGTIGYALFKAAQKGKMDCFEKLAPHATEEWISVALSKLSDENLEHPSVLMAANNVSKSWAFKDIIRRAKKASNVKLLAQMLPFMSITEIDLSFISSCKNEESFETAKQLFKFAKDVSVGRCLKAAVDGKMKRQIILLLPRLERKKLAEISQSPVFGKFDDDTRQAIEGRINNFPTEIAIELAFLPKDKDVIHASLKAELGEYNAKSGKDKTDLVCKNRQKCIAEVRKDPSALMFPVEQAIGRLLERAEDNAALERLAPFAAPRASTMIMSTFSKHGSKKATKACAKKVLKEDVAAAVRSAQSKKNFELMKFLVPFLSPLGIIELLEPRFPSDQVDADRLKAMLAGLPSALADDALRIAVRGTEEKREESVHYLLPKASPAAIDEVYLFAKRINFNDALLEKAASVTAKVQGREIERGKAAK